MATNDAIFETLNAMRFKVPTFVNQLDVLKEMISSWRYYDWSGKYATGNYADVADVNMIFRYDEGSDIYAEISDPDVVSEYILRHKLMGAIDEAISADPAIRESFEDEIETELRIGACSASSVSGGNRQSKWEIHGDLVVVADADISRFDRALFVERAEGLGLDSICKLANEFFDKCSLRF